MICQQCGAQVKEGNRFCEMCGSPVQQAQPVQPTQPTQPVQPVQPIQPVQPVQPIQPVKPINSNPQPIKPLIIDRPPFSNFCIAGLITAIFQIGILGLIFGIIGLKECSSKGKRGMAMGIIAIILSIADVALWIVVLCIFGYALIYDAMG